MSFFGLLFCKQEVIKCIEKLCENLFVKSSQEQNGTFESETCDFKITRKKEKYTKKVILQNEEISFTISNKAKID